MKGDHLHLRPTVLALLVAVVTTLAAAADRAPDPVYTPVEPLGPTVVARPGTADVLDLAACLEAALAGNDSLLAQRERRTN